MAFADPQSITINAVANSLARTSSDKSAGTFKKDDGSVVLKVSHQGTSRPRHLIRVDHSKIAADPLLAGVNVRASMSAYLVIDVPLTGYTLAEQKQVVDGFLTYLTASTGAKITQLLGSEN